MRIAVLGRTHWLLETAKALASSDHKISLVATTTAAPQYSSQPDDFADFARSHGASFYLNQDINSKEFVARVVGSKSDVAVSVNWPTLLKREICEALSLGVLNAHAGDLPRYRGNACPNWAIINNESRVGLCIHAMEPGALDAGPIYSRSWLQLTDETYISDIYSWLDTEIPARFAEAIERIAEPTFSPIDQTEIGPRPLRSFPRRPEDSAIDWRMPAADIARLIRASSRPLAGAFTHLEGDDQVTIWRGCPTSLDYDVLAVPGQILGRGKSGGLIVACGEGILEAQEYEVKSEKTLSFSSSYRFFSRPK